MREGVWDILFNSCPHFECRLNPLRKSESSEVLTTFEKWFIVSAFVKEVIIDVFNYIFEKVVAVAFSYTIKLFFSTTLTFLCYFP